MMDTTPGEELKVVRRQIAGLVQLRQVGEFDAAATLRYDLLTQIELFLLDAANA